MNTTPRRHFRSFTFAPIAICCVLGLGGGVPLHADVVTDFSITNGNPNGVWSYGTLSSLTGGTFTLFTDTEDGNGQEVWYNGGSIPNEAAVQRNASGSTITESTVVLPTNLLRLDGENFIDDVRWTAPTTGVYNLVGLFQRIDTVSHPINVAIIENSTTTLFSVNNFATFGNQKPFNLTNVALSAGTTLDFAEAPAQDGFNDSTGFDVTISNSNSVPEPSSLLLTGLSAAALSAGVWFRRWKPSVARHVCKP